MNNALPHFDQVKPADIEPNLDAILAQNRHAIHALLEKPTLTWEGLMTPLQELDIHLSNMWSPIHHLHSVMNAPQLREAYNACLPKLSAYSTELGHNVKGYEAVKALSEAPEYKQFNSAQKKVLEHSLRDFRLAGVALPKAKKKRFAMLQEQLTQATTQFEQNLLDATQAWTHLVTDPATLDGLPAHAQAAAKQAAEQQQKTGWLFTLEMPSYIAVMTYAKDRSFRETMYTAFTTRASDQGPNAGQYDNSNVMHTILTLRLELAQLLGFDTFAERSLATKMAQSPDEVLSFLKQLIDACKPQAEQEFAALTEFAQHTDGLDELKPWDIAYYSERYQQTLHSFSQEAIRPYFPAQYVLSGLFEIIRRLYQVTIKPAHNNHLWHPDVTFYELSDENAQTIGHIYVDLYARRDKRGGAWMDECRVRCRRADGHLQLPVAFVTCNFNAPVGNDPALLSHTDVVTLFHEFGHALQHVLTQIEYADVSGISGIPWDAVELPSQFNEHWCWQKEVSSLIGKHYQTGESIPDTLFDALCAARTFQSAMQMVRQLEFSLFDFRLHYEFNPDTPNQIQHILDEVRTQVAVVPTVSFNRFQHSFAHIFAGGYAAGYYSYKWAEVLSSDAFSLFEEQGIFDPTTGRSFRQHILEPGGSAEPMDLFIAFRGRKPSIDALLRHNGIARTQSR